MLLMNEVAKLLLRGNLFQFDKNVKPNHAPLNTFVPSAPVLYPPKTSEKLTVV